MYEKDGGSDDHVRLGFIFGKGKAHRGEVAAQFLTVGLVLLAAVGVDQRKGAPACTQGTYLLTDLQLTRHGFGRDLFSFVAHKRGFPLNGLIFYHIIPRGKIQ